MNLASSFFHTVSLAKSTPSLLEVKIAAIYLVEDIEGATRETGYNGNNIGNQAKIYIAPGCDDSLTDSICAAGMTAVNLAGTTEQVNATLNSQIRDINKGTYRYVRLALLGSQQGATNTYNNIKWSASSGSLSAENREVASVVTEITRPLETPLEIGSGDSVTLNLTYSLQESVTFGDSTIEVMQPGQGTYQLDASQRPKNDDRKDQGTSNAVCLKLPEFVPNATK